MAANDNDGGVLQANEVQLRQYETMDRMLSVLSENRYDKTWCTSRTVCIAIDVPLLSSPQVMGYPSQQRLGKDDKQWSPYTADVLSPSRAATAVRAGLYTRNVFNT